MYGSVDLMRCSGCHNLDLVDPWCLVKEERYLAGSRAVSFDSEKAGCEKEVIDAVSFYLNAMRGIQGL